MFQHLSNGPYSLLEALLAIQLSNANALYLEISWIIWV